ncbi:antibiotic biosynthesis monooxygenase [Actinomadura sp. LOL_016]|uniref:antibiotic biosynthesis monooxygenase n=1 Tax=unclassified Actinomadura TaxID=2626254 RepID=UPI003A7FCE20
MIIRIWHGWTDTAGADVYQDLLDAEIVPGIIGREVTGLHGVDVLRRESSQDEVEFVTVMTFDDWAAVEAFAGTDRTAAVVPPAARAVLRRFDPESQHYELVKRYS